MEREELRSLLHAVYAAIAVGLVVGVLVIGLVLLLGGHTPLGTGARGLGLIVAIIGVLAGHGMQAAVERALARLTGSQAKAIALFGIDGLPHDEVARIMGCSAGAVRWHVHRARRKLRVLLREYLE